MTSTRPKRRSFAGGLRSGKFAAYRSTLASSYHASSKSEEGPIPLTSKSKVEEIMKLRTVSTPEILNGLNQTPKSGISNPRKALSATLGSLLQKRNDSIVSTQSDKPGLQHNEARKPPSGPSSSGRCGQQFTVQKNNFVFGRNCTTDMESNRRRPASTNSNDLCIENCP